MFYGFELFYWVGQADRHYWFALTQAYADYARGVGDEARWFSVCECHQHIWSQKISDRAKQKLFVKETGYRHCIWVGRSASAMARGHWNSMCGRLIDVGSPELHRRLSLLPADRRGHVVAYFDTMKCMTVEEWEAKFCYWDELPHLLCGMWPFDEKSQFIAVKARTKYREAMARDGGATCHRVTYRIMSPDSGTRFAAMVDHLIDAGNMLRDLEDELRAMNMLPTCEQRIEGAHAAIHGLNAHPGRNLDAPQACALMRERENFEQLENWQCRAFVVHTWRMPMHRWLLAPLFNAEFRAHAPYSKCIAAVYHCLPRQMFANLNFDKVVIDNFGKRLKPAKSDVPASHRLAIDYVKERLPPGTIFSVPDEIAAVVSRDNVDEGASTGALAVAIVPGATPSTAEFITPTLQLAAAQATSKTAVELQRSDENRRFIGVVKPKLESRFVQYDDGKRVYRIAVVEIRLSNIDTADRSGMFASEENAQVMRINLSHCLERPDGFRGLLADMVIWDAAPHPQVRLCLEDDRDAAPSMLPMGAMGARPRAMVGQLRFKKWENMVSDIVNLPGALCDHGAHIVAFDAITMELKARGAGSEMGALEFLEDGIHAMFIHWVTWSHMASCSN